MFKSTKEFEYDQKRSAFISLCAGRGATFVGIYVPDGKGGYTTHLEAGDDNTKAHLYSQTKSFACLVYVNELAKDPSFVHDSTLCDISPDEMKIEGACAVRLVDLCNHTSGIVSGLTAGNFGAAEILYLMRDPAVSEIINNCIHRFDISKIGTFSYDNMGSLLFAKMFEDTKRMILCKDERTERLWYIKDEAKRMGLFDGLVESVDYEWQTYSTVGVDHYTCGFTGLMMKGSAMAKVAQTIFKNYKHLLEFIIGSSALRFPTGDVLENRDIVVADDTNIAASVSGSYREGKAGEYRYSHACWIPNIPGRRCLAFIGMLGQLTCFDMDTGIIMIRQHKLQESDIAHPTNLHREFMWDASSYLKTQGL